MMFLKRAIVGVVAAASLAALGAVPAQADTPPVGEGGFLAASQAASCARLDSTFSGWPVITEAGTTVIAGGSKTTRVRAGDVATIFSYFAAQYNARVEKISSFYGYRSYADNVKAGGSCNSDHLGGAAVDFNGSAHKWEKRTGTSAYPANGGFSSAQLGAIRAIQGELSGVLKWGGDYKVGNRDPMHFYVAGSTAEVAAVARAISAPPSGVPAATARAYVTKAFGDLLGRGPDAQALAFWSGPLASGTWNYEQVANGITGSDEFRGHLIDSSYRQYLGRVADAGGLSGWLDSMRGGMTIEGVQANLLGSQEAWAQAGGTAPGWVASLYRKVLGRGAGQSEIDSWVGQINAGASLVSVASGFLYSQEHLNAVVDGYYRAYLGRGVDPTGQATRVSQIQSGVRDEQVIAALASSPEYLGHI